MSHLQKLLFALLLAGTALLPGKASAQVNCNVTFNPLAFPATMDVLPGAAIDTGSSVDSGCTGITGTTKVLLCYSLNNGTYPLSGTSRQMGSGANRLLFQAYLGSAGGTVWGTSGTGQMRVLLNAATPSTSTPYYGRVMGGQQTAVPAAYSTVMTATVYGRTYTTATAPACPTAALGTFNFNVTGTVISACNATASNLTFPDTSFFAANIDWTSVVSVTCTRTTPYHVRLSGGNAVATDPTQRKMSHISTPANKVTYGLYRDVPRTQPWGSTDGVNTVDATGTAALQSHTVYGRVPPQASQPPGIYRDVIVVEVSFL